MDREIRALYSQNETEAVCVPLYWLLLIACVVLIGMPRRVATSIHSPASLYTAFSAAEARRLTRKLEWHYTPKHASWLNMVEIELSILGRQCLDRRIPNVETLRREVAAWEQVRNDEQATVSWHFTSNEARKKLARFYPS